VITAVATDNLASSTTSSAVTITVAQGTGGGTGGTGNSDPTRLKNLFHQGDSASIPCSSTVNIYGRDGAHICSLSCNAGVAVWDGTNGGGYVSSGWYLALVDGQKKKIVFVK
jgi:hypothetical protein